MIDAAISLLETTRLPTWQEDTAVRREMETLREEVKAFSVIAYDRKRAAKRAVEINRRAERIQGLLRGHRNGRLRPVTPEDWEREFRRLGASQ